MFVWLDQFATKIVEGLLNIPIESKLGGSLHFFIYDSIKILILLGFMIFVISYIRSYFSPEKTKRIVSKLDGVKGNFAASLLGIVTPFCSCSSVPIFIGFVEARIPLGYTFSFLITSPIVNEAAFAILLGYFGVKVAVLYVLMGVLVGVVGGIIINKLSMGDQVESYVYEIEMAELEEEKLDFKGRLEFAKNNTLDVIKRVWIFVFLGIAIGAAIHGWAPEDFLVKYASEDNPLGVIVATIIAIPLYSNAIGTIPIASALIGKGVGLGTALAFMMATTALSLPEMILLRKVIKPKLIATFVAIVGVGIIIVGYLFNML